MYSTQNSGVSCSISSLSVMEEQSCQNGRILKRGFEVCLTCLRKVLYFNIKTIKVCKIDISKASPAIALNSRL